VFKLSCLISLNPAFGVTYTTMLYVLVWLVFETHNPCFKKTKHMILLVKYSRDLISKASGHTRLFFDIVYCVQVSNTC